MKKFIFSLLLSASLFAAETKPLVVGTTSGYAPFVSLDSKGNYEGFDIDFAEELGKKLGRKIILKDCGTMPGLLLSLDQKKVDIVIWAVSITPERETKMDMVYYQGEKVQQMPFLFWKEIPSNIDSIEDLGTKIKGSVSVEAGSFQEGVLKNYPKVRLKQVEKISDALMEIRYGKSIAAMADPSLVQEITSQYPEIKVLQLPLRPEEYSLGNGICINKKDKPLTQSIEQAVQELQKEGVIADLEKKWGIIR